MQTEVKQTGSKNTNVAFGLLLAFSLMPIQRVTSEFLLSSVRRILLRFAASEVAMGGLQDTISYCSMAGCLPAAMGQ